MTSNQLFSFPFFNIQCDSVFALFYCSVPLFRLSSFQTVDFLVYFSLFERKIMELNLNTMGFNVKLLSEAQLNRHFSIYKILKLNKNSTMISHVESVSWLFYFSLVVFSFSLFSRLFFFLLKMFYNIKKYMYIIS